MVRSGKAGRGKARLGLAWRGKARQGEAGIGMAWLGKGGNAVRDASPAGGLRRGARAGLARPGAAGIGGAGPG